jgi:D-alanyl-lipoteichoic acid acyltransferase DltB (MBOAT superfamily)
MDHLAVGLTIFFIGMFKKVVIADHIASYANQLFDGVISATAPTFSEAWIGSLAYTFQLYFDFSGYSDMAIGLGRMFGIFLPLNFNSPYKATSIVDFWRRWHVTLSAFLRDYLYVPLGGNRRGPLRRYLNLMATMLLGGLWHGAGWNFVVWGGLHGSYLCVNNAWAAIANRLGWQEARKSLLWKTAAGSITFLAVVVGWVFFRAATFGSAWSVIVSMSGFNGFDLNSVYKPVEATTTLLIVAAVVWCLPNTQQIMSQFRPVDDWKRVRDSMPPVSPGLRWMIWRPTMVRALLMIGCAMIVFMNMNRVQEFLYFQF